MVVHHLPSITRFHEDIGRLRQRSRQSFAGIAGDFFDARHPGHRPAKLKRHTVQAYPQLARIGKNAFPASLDLVPAGNSLPSGMHTDHPVLVQPDAAHGRDAAPLERLIKLTVDVQYGVFGRTPGL